MVDEPEMGIRFQYKMSLKTRLTSEYTADYMLRVDEHHHAEFGAIEFDRNEGVRRGNRKVRLSTETRRRPMKLVR